MAGGRGQRVYVHRVRLGGKEFRVVRSPAAGGRLTLRADHHWLSMRADRDGVARLVAMWALAARSKRSLVYLPLRSGAVPDDDGDSIPLDLVLVHHSLQFPIAAWKRIRRRLGTGMPQSVDTMDDDFPDQDAIDYQRRHHRNFRDHLGFDIAARTLFIVGSATAFRENGSALRVLRDEAPAYLHHFPARHFCVELEAWTWSRPAPRPGVPADLHIHVTP